MKQIFVYVGEGAYQARDIENFLNVFDVEYRRICEHNLSHLSNNDIFIVPGGQVDCYLSSFGDNGIKLIREFVEKGGIYIGICAGAYITGKKYKNENGLDFFDKSFSYISHQGIKEVKDKAGQSLELLAENGPDLSIIESGDILLKDDKGNPQAIKLIFSKGVVYLFSSHPEGSLYYKKLPQEFSGARWFLNFLKNI